MSAPSSPNPAHRPSFGSGIGTALLAALLFGTSTPVAKLLLVDAGPWMIAGLLYLGSGIGLSVVRAVRRTPRAGLPRGDWPWFIGAIIAGGVLAPVLLMQGLARMPASGAALLLNMEGVLTAVLAWLVFKENFDRRIAVGMACIVAGAVVLSWPDELRLGDLLPSLLVLGACVSWALDNNLTRHVALADAGWIASIKGISAGSVNLLLAYSLGAKLPHWPVIGATLGVGFLAYGVSLTLFVIALRHLGTARTGAYFSIAPFFGALVAIALLGEPASGKLIWAGLLMAIGTWLHVTEHHNHLHAHDALEHEHGHEHDLHHRHEHSAGTLPGARHTHRHRHEPMTHSHAHYPDAHHRHTH